MTSARRCLCDATGNPGSSILGRVHLEGSPATLTSMRAFPVLWRWAEVAPDPLRTARLGVPLISVVLGIARLLVHSCVCTYESACAVFQWKGYEQD